MAGPFTSALGTARSMPGSVIPGLGATFGQYTGAIAESATAATDAVTRVASTRRGISETLPVATTLGGLMLPIPDNARADQIAAVINGWRAGMAVVSTQPIASIQQSRRRRLHCSKRRPPSTSLKSTGMGSLSSMAAA